jgi:3-isopropylmalate/(R)-2-methylmalate dehydratase small subunit
LNEYGIRAIIAPSYADIFRNNCLQNGMLPVELPEERVQALIQRAQDQAPYTLTVDLEEMAVYDDEGFVREPFVIDPFVRERLLNGLDDIGLTLKLDDAITRFEKRRPAFLEVRA